MRCAVCGEFFPDSFPGSYGRFCSGVCREANRAMESEHPYADEGRRPLHEIETDESEFADLEDGGF